MRNPEPRIIILKVATKIGRKEKNSPGDAHDDSHDDGNLHSADDCCNKHIVQLLPTGHNVQDVEVLGVTLRTSVARLTPVNKAPSSKVE